MHFSITLALVLSAFMPFALAGPGEVEVLRRLKDRVNMHEPPQVEGNDPVTVTFGVDLINVVRADPDTNQVELVLWVYTEWKDDRLTYGDDTLGGNVSMVRVKSGDMWSPDVTLYSLTAPPEYFIQDLLNVIRPDGTVLTVHTGKFKVQCDLDGLETSTGAECILKFGSWTHSAADLDLQFYGGSRQMDLSYMFGGSKYELTENAARRKTTIYACCPEPYVDMEYSLSIRTKGSGGSVFGLFD